MPYPPRHKKGRLAAPQSVSSSVSRQSVNNDLHTTVLRLTHSGAGRHQKMRVAEALDDDGILRYPIAYQFALHCPGTTHRQALIVAWGSRRVGISVHLNAGVLDPRGIVGGLLDDLTCPIR